MECTLSELLPEEAAVVTRVELPELQVRRLAAFGLVPGTGVRCRLRGGKGRILALEFRGCVVALRRRQLLGIVGKRVMA